MIVAFEITGSPRGKGRPRFLRKSGFAYTPAETRSYENLLRAAAQDAMQGAPPLDCAVRLKMTAIMPVPASWSNKKRALALAGEIRPVVKPDADNLLKMADALNQVVFHDDRQVVEARVVKCYGDRPSLRVEIEPWSFRPLGEIAADLVARMTPEEKPAREDARATSQVYPMKAMPPPPAGD
jgi:Holliday junction resolvase RusA-like endonuclease